uniref:Uncharacterized protein n=1 Tax=viral metagenome TaxID=1070528 RepID=A0A6C0IWP8_9ZZZZ
MGYFKHIIWDGGGDDDIVVSVYVPDHINVDEHMRCTKCCNKVHYTRTLTHVHTKARSWVGDKEISHYTDKYECFRCTGKNTFDVCDGCGMNTDTEELQELHDYTPYINICRKCRDARKTFEVTDKYVLYIANTIGVPLWHVLGRKKACMHCKDKIWITFFDKKICSPDCLKQTNEFINKKYHLRVKQDVIQHKKELDAYITQKKKYTQQISKRLKADFGLKSGDFRDIMDIKNIINWIRPVGSCIPNETKTKRAALLRRKWIRECTDIVKGKRLIDISKVINKYIDIRLPAGIPQPKPIPASPQRLTKKDIATYCDVGKYKGVDLYDVFEQNAGYIYKKIDKYEPNTLKTYKYKKIILWYILRIHDSMVHRTDWDDKEAIITSEHKNIYFYKKRKDGSQIRKPIHS